MLCIEKLVQVDQKKGMPEKKCFSVLDIIKSALK